MKKLLFMLLLFVTANAMAQVQDSVLSKSEIGDSIVMYKGAIELEPFEVGVNSDTVRSMTVNLLDVTSDTTLSILSYVRLFDKNCKQLQEFNIVIPPTVPRNWTARFNYIVGQRKKLVWLK